MLRLGKKFKKEKKGDEDKIESTSISFENLLMKLAENDEEIIKSAEDWFYHSKFDDYELSKLLTFSVERGYLKIVELFVTDKRKAVKRKLNDFDFTNYLNNPYIDNLNIVMLSIKQRCLTLLKWFVNKKMYSLSNDGINPVLLAMQSGQVDILKFVMAKTNNYDCFTKGEKIIIRDEKGNPPLVFVAKHGYVEMFEWIFDRYDSSYTKYFGPKWYKDDFGRTRKQFYNKTRGDNPVHVAVKYRRIEILKFLINIKPRLRDIPNLTNGNCAIHLAARDNYLEALHYLLGKSCNFLIKNKYGNCPIHLAAKEGHVEAVQMLLQHGCPRDIKNKKGETIYDIASRYDSEGHRTIVNLARGIQKIPPLDGPPREDSFLETFDALLNEMLSKENFNEAMLACLHVIQDESKSPDIQSRARLTLSNMLLRGDCILPEQDGNPLEKIVNSVFQANESRIKRSIQAFYLLRNDESEEASEIRMLLHKHLSGIDFSEIPPETLTKDNWLPGIFNCYTAYFLFKEYGSTNTHTNMLINHFVDSAVNELENSKTSSPVSSRARFSIFESARSIRIPDLIPNDEKTSTVHVDTNPKNT